MANTTQLTVSYDAENAESLPEPDNILVAYKQHLVAWCVPIKNNVALMKALNFFCCFLFFFFFCFGFNGGDAY